MQFALSAARMARVSGAGCGLDGPRVGQRDGRADAIERAAHRPGLTTSQTGPDGSFTFANVAPGDYVANVQLMPGLSGANVAGVAAVPVSVGGSDLNGLRIATGPGVLISGHVEFEGTSSRTAPTPWRVFTQANVPAQVTFGAGSLQANGLVGEDGSFQLQVAAAAAPSSGHRDPGSGRSRR